MSQLIDATVHAMAPQYPELNDEAERIRSVAIGEESTFETTLRTGTVLFETAVAEAKQSGSTVLPGEQAFSLHDTYGFPIDLTLEMASEAGLTVEDSQTMARGDAASAIAASLHASCWPKNWEPLLTAAAAAVTGHLADVRELAADVAE